MSFLRLGMSLHPGSSGVLIQTSRDGPIELEPSPTEPVFIHAAEDNKIPEGDRPPDRIFFGNCSEITREHGLWIEDSPPQPRQQQAASSFFFDIGSQETLQLWGRSTKALASRWPHTPTTMFVVAPDDASDDKTAAQLIRKIKEATNYASVQLVPTAIAATHAALAQQLIRPDPRSHKRLDSVGSVGFIEKQDDRYNYRVVPLLKVDKDRVVPGLISADVDDDPFLARQAGQQSVELVGQAQSPEDAVSALEAASRSKPALGGLIHFIGIGLDVNGVSAVRDRGLTLNHGKRSLLHGLRRYIKLHDESLSPYLISFPKYSIVIDDFEDGIAQSKWLQILGKHRLKGASGMWIEAGKPLTYTYPKIFNFERAVIADQWTAVISDGNTARTLLKPLPALSSTEGLTVQAGRTQKVKIPIQLSFEYTPGVDEPYIIVESKEEKVPMTLRLSWSEATPEKDHMRVFASGWAKQTS